MRKFNKRMPKFVTKSVNCSTKFSVKNNESVECSGAQNVVVSNGLKAAEKVFTRKQTTVGDVYGICDFGDKVLYLSANGLYEASAAPIKKAELKADKQSVICTDEQTNRLFVTTAEGTVRYNGDSDENTLMVPERMSSLVSFNGRVFGASGKRLYFTDTEQTSFNQDDDGGNIEFASAVSCICVCKGKLYVFADGVYAVTLDLDEDFFVVTKICESIPNVSFVAAVCDRLYCACGNEIFVFDGKFSKLSLSVGNIGDVCSMNGQNGMLIFADDKQTVFFNPTTEAVTVYDFGAKSAALTSNDLMLCNGKDVVALQDNVEGGIWTGVFDFGYASAKCLRKAVFVGGGKSVITVKSGGRYVTVDLDGDGEAVSVPCYIVGRRFDVTVKLTAGAWLSSIAFVGTVFDEEVKL